MTSEYGLKMRSLRPIEVESVFGDIKGNFGVRRFILKGLEKVKMEWGLHCIAHNMRKLATVFGIEGQPIFSLRPLRGREKTKVSTRPL